MTRSVLVLGAGGNFGARAAEAFSTAGWQVRRYARGTDMAVAARGADLIVNALNPPNYHNWATLIPEITESVLAAARSSGAAVLVPGNVYVYGDQKGPWGPDTPHLPVARKGRIRTAMEARYREAADKGQRVILLRGGDFVDPVSPATIWRIVMLKGVSQGRLTAMGNPEARRAYAWLPDMARVAVALAEHSDLPAFADVPFPGQANSLSQIAGTLERMTGQSYQVKKFPWWALKLASPFWELARELSEMRYLHDLDHRLDPSPLAGLLPDFRPTTLEQMLTAHRPVRG
ncbi:MAG TPA: epimerase [Albidovulum sp.]|uniref:epimerase n=1 Tax=Albidovulum sp. TaxID=1872424 RepID=UPI002B52D84E|nr:epimerase [Albidovulum sp.]